MEIIPAIDLIDGQVVRLFQGDYNQKTGYTKDPVDYAQDIYNLGIKSLHLVDLSGAKIGKLVHTPVLQEMTSKTGLNIDFGGGVKTEKDVEEILHAGAAQVVIGSLCVRQPELVVTWIEKFGVDRFVLALDTDGVHLKISGWQEDSGVTLESALEYFKSFDGLRILTTDIRRDGTGTGPSVELYKTLVSNYSNLKWIASGGVENMNDLRELRNVGCFACVVGKALLDGKIYLEDVKAFNDEISL